MPEGGAVAKPMLIFLAVYMIGYYLTEFLLEGRSLLIASAITVGAFAMGAAVLYGKVVVLRNIFILTGFSVLVVFVNVVALAFVFGSSWKAVMLLWSIQSASIVGAATFLYRYQKFPGDDSRNSK